MIIEISEKNGELNFGVFWISLDGRLETKWFQTFKEAEKQYAHLKDLRREPSLICTRLDKRSHIASCAKSEVKNV